MFRTTNSRLEPGLKESYGLLPFRALQEDCLPAAIQQRWEASVAASKSAEWRLWFQMLDQMKQKEVVECLSMGTRDRFWAGLWLEYEEWSKPRRIRHIAAAARVQVILERETVRMQMEEIKWARILLNVSAPPVYQPYQMPPEPGRAVPGEYNEITSAPITPQAIVSLELRLTPIYFRLPYNAVRFATQIFSGKSHGEAVAEQKANFNSWTKEHKVRRIEGMPEFVVWGNIAVHKDAVPAAKFVAKRKQMQTGKHRYQKRQKSSKSADE